MNRVGGRVTMDRSAALLCVALAIAAFIAGCASRQIAEPAGPQAAALTPTEYAELAARTAERSSAIAAIWARSVTNVWYPDEKGEEQSEQAEGHFNFRRPRGLVLTLGKVGEIGAVLGSNDERFWWAELRDPKRALVGTHARANPERVRELGLPVLPRDLIELLGVSALPASPVSAVWSADGTMAIVTIERAVGRAVLTYTRGSGEPARVELWAEQETSPALWSELSAYETLVRRGGSAPSTVRVPTQILVAMDGGRARARIRLSEPEQGGTRPRPSVFEVETWTRSYGITDIADLDLEPAAASR